MKAKGRIDLAIAAILWALAGICIKKITWSSLAMIFPRSVLMLLLFFALRRSFHIKWTKTNVLGGAMLSITGVLYVAAIKLTTAGTAVVLQYFAPVIVFIYAVIFQHRKARLSEIFITLAVFSGIVLSCVSDLAGSRLTGNILGLLSGVSFAANIILMNGKQSDTYDTVMISAVLTMIFSLPFAVFDKSASFDINNVIWILVLGLLQYGLANYLYCRGIKKVDNVEASVIMTLEPVFNPIPVALFCGEMMSPKAIIGAVIVILGIIAYTLVDRLTRAEPCMVFSADLLK